MDYLHKFAENKLSAAPEYSLRGPMDKASAS